MAIVLAHLSSWDARNKFGPLQVFTGWRTLPVVRSLVVPTNPRTTGQSEVRSILTTLSQAWGSLTAGQVAAWRDWANSHEYVTALGQKFRGTGLNAYLELNFPLVYNSVAAKASPPTVALKPGFAGFAAVTGSAVNGEIACSWTKATGSDADDWYRLDITSQMPNEHRLAQASDWRIAQFVTGTAATQSIVDLVPDGWYWVRCRFVQDDGQSSGIMVAQAQASSGI